MTKTVWLFTGIVCIILNSMTQTAVARDSPAPLYVLSIEGAVPLDDAQLIPTGVVGGGLEFQLSQDWLMLVLADLSLTEDVRVALGGQIGPVVRVHERILLRTTGRLRVTPVQDDMEHASALFGGAVGPMITMSRYVTVGVSVGFEQEVGAKDRTRFLSSLDLTIGKLFAR